jgi:hypothetical protein
LVIHTPIAMDDPAAATVSALSNHVREVIGSALPEAAASDR